MIKASTLLFLHAETSLHPGSGESAGAVDLAVQRERFTGFPTIAGSGLKGPARRAAMPASLCPDGKPKTSWENLSAEEKAFFALYGPDTGNADKHGGAAAFSDARILLFPVRSLRGVFAWVTCPLALGRLEQDLLRVTKKPTEAFPWKAATNQPLSRAAYGADAAAGEHACGLGKPEKRQVVLEDESFDLVHRAEVPTLADWLAGHAFPKDTDFFRTWLKTHLLVLSDDHFAHFVQHATEIQARVSLNEHKTTTGGTGNLFYQENLPPESVMYSVVGAQDDLSGHISGSDGKADAMLSTLTKGLNDGWMQVGGDESVGKGIVRLSVLHEKQADGDGTKNSFNEPKG